MGVVEDLIEEIIGEEIVSCCPCLQVVKRG